MFYWHLLSASLQRFLEQKQNQRKGSLLVLPLRISLGRSGAQRCQKADYRGPLDPPTSDEGIVPIIPVPSRHSLAGRLVLGLLMSPLELFHTTHAPRPTLLLKWLFVQRHQQRAPKLDPFFLSSTKTMANSLLFYVTKGKDYYKTASGGVPCCKTPAGVTCHSQWLTSRVEKKCTACSWWSTQLWVGWFIKTHPLYPLNHSPGLMRIMTSQTGGLAARGSTEYALSLRNSNSKV